MQFKKACLLALAIAAAPFVATAPASAEGSGNWMRDAVHARELAEVLQRLGPEAAARMRDSRIIGGTPAQAGRWPFQVAILTRNVADPVQAQFCGGTLISPRFVVTAAHCLEGTPASAIQVLTGTQNLAAGGVRRNVNKIVLHPAYDNRTFDNDIAVIRLVAPATGIPLASMVTPAQEASVARPGVPAIVTGWGDTTRADPNCCYPAVLRQVTVPIVSRQVCNAPQSYDGTVTVRMLCAGYRQGGKDACQGDSGGPLTVPDAQNRYRILVGVVSSGVECAAPNLYGLYSRVAVLRQFVINVMNAG